LLVSSSIDSRGVFSQVRNLCWVHIPQACCSPQCSLCCTFVERYVTTVALKRPPARFCLSFVLKVLDSGVPRVCNSLLQDNDGLN